MVDPVGFAEAWRAQFADSEPPRMALQSVGDIEAELERCKASIRRLELEVNKERFRMIYLQTLLAKERKSYDRQRWGFKRSSHVPDEADAPPEQPPAPSKPRPAAPRKLAAASPPEGPPSGSRSLDEAGEGSPGKVRPPPCRRRLPSASAEPEGGAFEPVGGKERGGSGGGSVAALRSSFERLRKGAAAAAAGEAAYVNLEYHHEKGLVKVNDKEVSERISSLGSQAMQLERRRVAAGDPPPPRTPFRGRSAESSFAFDADFEDAELNARFLQDNLLLLQQQQANGGGRPGDCQPYQRVYVGGLLGAPGPRPPEQEKHLTWPRRSCSPRGFEDGGGGGGGYTPDCSSNENLTSSEEEEEEDFSSGRSSSHVSPSPTAPGRLSRDKSRSPSQHSLDSSSSPPTPQAPKRHRQAQPAVVVSEAAIVGVRKAGQIWPGDGELAPGRAALDPCFHGDAGGRPPLSRGRGGAGAVGSLGPPASIHSGVWALLSGPGMTGARARCSSASPLLCPLQASP